VSEIQEDKQVVAAFDFDGTLTRRDTLFYFLLYIRSRFTVFRDAVMLSPILVGYALGWIRNDVAKERVFARCLAGIRLDDLKQQGERFSAEILPGLLRKEALARLGWHKNRGHRCIVISASLDLYVRPWAMRMGFDDVIASHLETFDDGTITGNLSGGNCFGAEKVIRLEALLGSISGYTLYAYGDSRGDSELLSVADYAYYRHFPV